MYVIEKDIHQTIFHSFVLIHNECQETRMWGNKMSTCQHNYQCAVFAHTEQFKIYADKCRKCDKIKQYPLKEMKILSQLFG